MSNIDKHALREAAEKALPAMMRLLMMPNDELFDEALLNVDGDVDAANAFNLLTGPETVLALLDELEAKDNRINRLEAIVAVAEQRNALMREWKRALKVPCDLVDDQVPVVIHGMVIRLERLKETEDKLTAAEKRIAEMQALARGIKQFSEFQICHYGATEDYAKGYIDCQNNYNKVLFAAADKGE